MAEIIHILIVDDHPIVSGGLKAMLDFEEDLEVVGQAADGVEAVEQYRRLRPDLVIMDLVMPKKDGVEAISDICAEDPGARILALTSYSESNKILLALRAGALGYILKNTRPAELLQAIRNVYHGMMVIQPAIMQQLLAQEEKDTRQPCEELTAREYEVLKRVARGKTNDEIAGSLSISKRTVNVHITHIMSKLGLVNRAQMALYALQHGIVGLFSSDNPS